MLGEMEKFILRRWEVARCLNKLPIKIDFRLRRSTIVLNFMRSGASLLQASQTQKTSIISVMIIIANEHDFTIN